MAPHKMLVSALATALLYSSVEASEPTGLRGPAAGLVKPEGSLIRPDTAKMPQPSAESGTISPELLEVLISKDWLEEADPKPTALPTNFKCSDATPCPFLMIADLDSGNKIEKGKKISFESALMFGSLIGDGKNYNIKFEDEIKDIATKYNEGGRGGELSELAVWNNKWLTADDRTGIVYQISKKSHKLLPRFIFNEGDGSKSAKGFKIEWMAVKDDKLVVGSHGNLRKDDDGVLGDSLQWVVFVDKNGKYTRQNWTQNYQKITEALGGGAEGYTTHEAIEWSDIHKKWVVLPRRLSTKAFDPKTDDYLGTNMMAICTENFSSCEAVEIKGLEKGNLKGFASFKFAPGSGDNVIVALRSAEDNANDTQESYLSVFTLQGALLIPETKVPKSQKLEGFAFI